tara:strand:- start:533 stop:1240 length:708 start_codon:yes stop_codon:yes gene_type:complete
MGFINNTSYILNAVLTKKGREYLAKSGGEFSITKFALSDDEIDYTLFNTAHPYGTNYYGAVLESTPMIEPNVDPEVVMKYKLISMPIGAKTLPFVTLTAPSSGYVGDAALEMNFNDENSANPWIPSVVTLNPSTEGGSDAFAEEQYSFLVLNKFVVDIRPGIGLWDELSSTAGVSYGEESGRTSKKVVSRRATIQTQVVTASDVYRETSIIITGQQSGAIYVLPVRVEFKNYEVQ